VAVEMDGVSGHLGLDYPEVELEVEILDMYMRREDCLGFAR